MLSHIIRFFLENRLISLLLLLLFVGWGLATAPFAWEMGSFPRDPVAVDAIPDIGENQQIVFTEWPGRSPQDIEDQITYPLSTALLGIPGVKTIRSNSMFGFSSIYLIFEEDIEFYWSRSRILEKLNSLSSGILPEGIQPSLGPDATALGQIFWYTLEGRDDQGNTTGGWDPHELRSIQDYYVRYALSATEGVSEVASIGGYVKEYQVDIDPASLVSYGVSLSEVAKAIQESNLDAGARTMELNQVEYLVRGIGYVKTLDDLESAVVVVRDNTPIRIRDLARVSMGPALRRGALDKAGAEAVGGVVVARYGENPLAVIRRIKEKIGEISEGLPSRELADGTLSKLTIVPFYDRSHLIQETLGTLNEALGLEILISILVVILMLANLRASILISGLLPVGVLMCFIAMRYLGVDANIVALSGIAIAIGTMVDVGIIMAENMLSHSRRADKNIPRIEVIYQAAIEVAPAILTAMATTIISFIPVFTLQAAEGKLFRPLAWTKTFALLAAMLLTLLVIPSLAYLLLKNRKDGEHAPYSFLKRLIPGALASGGLILLGIMAKEWVLAGLGGVLFLLAILRSFRKIPRLNPSYLTRLNIAWVGLTVTFLLSREWLPLGPDKSLFANMVFVAMILAVILGSFYGVIYFYSRILAWCLRYKAVFLSIPSFLILLAACIWMGFASVFGFLAKGGDHLGWNMRSSPLWSYMSNSFPGIGREFMPALDEGSFLLMPSSMPHAGMAQNQEVLRYLDMAVTAIPEVEEVVGKMGRVESALDPAPISMYENVINYSSEYRTDDNGRRMRFKVNQAGNFVRDEKGELIPDPSGSYFRQWREHIHSPDDIWDEIVKVSQMPGVTSAPKLQPIETRLVMLQTGMRAPMGIKVHGPDLKTIEAFGKELEIRLKQVPSVKAEAVFAERIVGKPYLNLEIDRDRISRYGLTVKQVQDHIQMAIGGRALTSTVEGRERYAIRLRYAREFRDSPEALGGVLVKTPTGLQIPLQELAEMKYVQGPQAIRSENTFLQGFVLFDKQAYAAETDVVLAVKQYLKEEIDAGNLQVPAGVSYQFAGNYENQVRAEKRLLVVVPLCLISIFILLYLQFRSIGTALMVFSGIAVAFSGGFLMLHVYALDNFLDISILGTQLNDLFQVHPVNLSVAVWVGFIALFGIATDDGVVIATYLDQSFAHNKPGDIASIRQAVIAAGRRRVRPCLMTTATTLLALLPILSSTGKGSDIMQPMAIPLFGGMTVALITLFVVPVLYAWREERRISE